MNKQEKLKLIKQQMLEDMKERYVEINMMPDFDRHVSQLFDIYARNYLVEHLHG